MMKGLSGLLGKFLIQFITDVILLLLLFNRLFLFPSLGSFLLVIE